ncbi:MAG: ABC transporter substrate-binding protein [Phycisphaerae bacterium]|nr:ABC transporter substrate-binding protein [Phycisphaerae bacterium]
MMTRAYPSSYLPPPRGHATAGPSLFLGRGALLAGILALLIVPAGCRKKASVPLRHTPAGVVQPVRIACSVPAATQILLQLGAAGDLVGVSSFDRTLLPPPLQALPVIGNYLHLDYETLLNVQPTVLVVQMAPARLPLSLTHFVRRNRIALVNVRLNTLQQLYASAKRLGSVTGSTARAARMIADAQARLAAIHRRYALRPHPRVVFLISTQPLMAVGKSTFLDQLIGVAGGNNVGEKLGSGYPALTRETLVDLKPQILLIGLPGEPAATGPADPRLAPWLALPVPAAQNHQVYLVTGGRSQMATLQVYKTAALVGRLIHGGNIRKSGG